MGGDGAQVVKLLASTIFVQFGAVFCGLVHYSTFMADGQGVTSIQSLGECATQQRAGTAAGRLTASAQA